MSKSLRNYLLFVVLAVLSVGLAVSSVLLWLVLPRGFHPARRSWVDIHKWGGLALSLAVIVHVAVHWGWLKRMTRRYLGNQRRRVTERQPEELPA
jgi:hypothetical protein